MEAKENRLIPVKDKRLKELISETGIEAKRKYLGKQDEGKSASAQVAD